MNSRNGLDLSEIRARLDAAQGPQYWRGLDQLAETEEFLGYLHREFPEQAAEWSDPATRRNFLKVTAASFALAGLTGCAYQPQEKIVPYVKSPEQIVQGKALFFASSMTLAGYATGFLVESQDGRPIKIEPNELHPASPRGVDIYSQASVLGLYDPDRSATVLRNGRPSSWEDFQSYLLSEFESRRGQPGLSGKVRLVTGAIGSPSLTAQIQQFLDAMPGAKWIQYEPVSRDNIAEGVRMATGQALEPVYKLDQARVILSLDCDFLSPAEPGHLAYASAFADGRDPDREGTGTPGEMNRLYAVECVLSLTGAKADHRLAMRPSQISDFAQALAVELGVAGVEKPEGELPAEAARWVGPIAKDLKSHDGQAVVMAGASQPPFVHALATAINSRLGAVGKAVQYVEPVVKGPTSGAGGLKQLVQEIDAGKVDLVILIGVNPVYDAPVDLNFRDALEQVKTRIHAGLYVDETGELCQWHAPLAHPLEAWGDGRTFDGTVTFQQPLIQPLTTGKSELELVAMMRGERNPSGRDLLESYWKAQAPFAGDPKSATKAWRLALHDGHLVGSASAAVAIEIKAASEWGVTPRPPVEGEVELVFQPDATVYDGRFANNGWLQELPKPLTKLTWDNVLLVSPSLAQSLRVSNGDVVSLTHRTRTLEIPVWIDPGHAPNAATISLGYGRKRAGRVGNGTGFNAYALRTSAELWSGGDVQLTRTNRVYTLATTQSQASLEGRNHIREANLEHYREHPDFVHELELLHSDPKSIYPPWKYDGYAWGMTIDLSRCVGCSSCIVACQSENNIPVVGKDQVSRKRALHWLEVDRYYSGEGASALDNPSVSFQPRMCMHCENAPCEVVCPVAATVHDHEGLNNMVYNRCVGTRYCSNNCPYKVRKFNFLRFSEHFFRKNSPTGETKDSPLQLMMNPDVTVRSRGVMEKCTYCVQRIYEGKIQAQLEDRKVRDGDVVTACQGACPTRAIVFGDINDEQSQVAKLKKRSRNYAMLAELNTAPRTSYLAGLRNPNPELEAV